MLTLLPGCQGGNSEPSPDGGRPDAAIFDGGGDGAADAASTEAQPLPAVGSRAFIHAGGSNRIDTFAVDLQSGAVYLRGTTQAGDDARLVDVDPLPVGSGQDKRLRAYVQTQMGPPHALILFEVDPLSGTLVERHVHPLPFPAVEGVTQIGFHPTARWFMVSASNRDPGLEDQLMTVDGEGRLGSPRTVSYDFYGFAWDPAGRFFYGLDGEAIFQHAFDAQAGGLARFAADRAEGSSGRVVLSLRPHPRGPWVYSVEEAEIGQFTFDGTSGLLTSPRFTANPVPAEAIYWTAARVDSAGRFLYVLGYLAGDRSALVDVFSIDETSGQLSFVERQKGNTTHGVQNTGLQAPLLLGDLLVIGGPSRAPGLEGNAALSIFRRGASDGRLTPVGDPVLLTPALKPSVSFLFAAQP